MTDFVCVAVIDPHGRVLLQERDEHARVAPGVWSLPGGGLEPGETPVVAAVRELGEETELVVAATDLTELGTFHVVLPGWNGQLEFRVFATRADVGNDDVVCHEGRQIVFVDRAAIDDLPVADATLMTLPALDAWIEETRTPPQLAGVILIDRQGRILLQQRDEHPALDPLKWGLVGGHLDEGEDFEPGAYRELEEETEIALPPGTLALFREYSVHGGRMQVFVAAVDLTDDDIECHEGLQIVFVDPERVPALDLGTSAALAVTELLASVDYADLTS